MALNRKILLIVSTALFLLIGALSVVSHRIILRSALAIERSHAGEDAMAARESFLSGLDRLEMALREFAASDRACAFIGAPAGNASRANAEPADGTFKEHEINLLLLMDMDGRVVYAKAYDHLRGSAVTAPKEIHSHLGAGSPLRLGGAPGSSLAGIILLPEAPMLVAARQILFGKGAPPARGVVIAGRYYYPEKERGFERRGGHLLATYRADDPALPPDVREAAGQLTPRNPVLIRPAGPGVLHAYTAVRDLHGGPAVYLRLRMPREIYMEGRRDVVMFVAALAAVGVAAGALIAVILRRQVISRLVRLSRDLSEIGRGGDLARRVRVEGRDELAALAAEINMMLTAIERSQADLCESEARYRTIVENTRDVIMLSRPDGTVLYISPSCRRVLGYEPEDLLNHRPMVWHPDDDGMVRRALKEAMNGAEASTLEYRIVTKDGSVKWISHAWAPVRSDGGLRMIVSVIQDITGHRRMEEELIKAQRLETVGVLAGGIAHDFNNILTAVWGYLSLAKAAVRPADKVAELLGEAERAAARARNLTRQLLSISKSGAPVRRPVQVGGVIREAAGLALSGSNVRCELDIPGNLRPADADEGQICQVLNNLVLNAIQAMPNGGVLRISARNSTAGMVGDAGLPPGDYVVISVKDDGTGIPEGDLRRLFDPYFTTKEHGSGLGLSISYSIIKNHRGTITVASAPGKGSTFLVYLPAAGAAAAPEAPGPGRQPRGAGRILLMDDDDAVRSVVGKMLRHIGYEVEYAGGGEEMLAAYRRAMEGKKPFDAVIMDLTISGGMGGREAIGKLLAIDPGALAVASSGYADVSMGAELSRCGFKGFIPKPYRVGDLAVELSRVLSGAGSGGIRGGGAT